jgi:hypothetical protein
MLVPAVNNSLQGWVHGPQPLKLIALAHEMCVHYTVLFDPY